MKALRMAVAALLLGTPLMAQAQSDSISIDTSSLGEEELSKTLELNGGIGGYYGEVGNRVNTGPAYGLTAGVQASELLGLEAAYLGHTNSIENSDGRLASNKFQVDIKAGPELMLPVPWRPYVFGGAGINFVSAGDNTQDLSNAVQGVIPLGVGADFFTDSRLRVGARGTYDWTPGVGGDVINDASNGDHPNEWQATLNAQAAF